MVLRMLIEFILDEASQMRTENTSFMKRIARPIIPYNRILSERDTNRDYLQMNMLNCALLLVHITIPFAKDQPYAFVPTGCKRGGKASENSKDL